MLSFRLRVSHPLWSAFPYASPNSSTATSGPYNPGRKILRFGLFRFRSPLLTESILFLFLTLLRCFTSGGIANPLLCIQSGTMRYEPHQVIPFGNSRVKACLQLSETYRSLPRPSSPASAKASTTYPIYLALLDPFRVMPLRAPKLVSSTYVLS